MYQSKGDTYENCDTCSNSTCCVSPWAHFQNTYCSRLLVQYPRDRCSQEEHLLPSHYSSYHLVPVLSQTKMNECRYCFETNGELLTGVCACRGTLAFVHADKCGICGHVYRIKRSSSVPRFFFVMVFFIHAFSIFFLLSREQQVNDLSQTETFQRFSTLTLYLLVILCIDPLRGLLIITLRNGVGMCVGAMGWLHLFVLCALFYIRVRVRTG
jgi:uncharacterized protein (DUF983 family)